MDPSHLATLLELDPVEDLPCLRTTDGDQDPLFLHAELPLLESHIVFLSKGVDAVQLEPVAED